MLEGVVVIRDHGPWIVQWAPVLSAAGAFAAAVFSARSIRLARLTQMDASRPQLASGLSMLDGDKQLHLHIENIGRGPAKKVGFYLLCEGQYATGTVYPNGILRSGRASWMVTGIAAGNPDSAQLMTYCLDRDNRVHVWSREGRYHSYEGDPQKVKTSRDLFAHWYGPVDESQLQRCAWSAKGPPS